MGSCGTVGRHKSSESIADFSLSFTGASQNAESQPPPNTQISTSEEESLTEIMQQWFSCIDRSRDTMRLPILLLLANKKHNIILFNESG